MQRLVHAFMVGASALAIAACHGARLTRADANPAARHTARPKGTTAAANGFWEYLPARYTGTSKSPLLVFWHGIGENGTGTAEDLAKVPLFGPPHLISIGTWNATLPLVVLSPQHGPRGCPSADEIHDFMAFALTHYSVDSSRVYLSGLSCGALGSANYLAKYGGKQVVASVLIAGNATAMWNARKCDLLREVALWSFHGDADRVVSITGNNTTMPNFMGCPAPRRAARYTVYPGVDHDSWSRTYDGSAGHDVYRWLLGISR